jgi:arylsulfatase A
VTFAEALKGAGYPTGMIGKWHQGYTGVSEVYHPQNHGFDEFVRYHRGNIDFVSHVGDHMKHDWWHGRE